MPPNRAQRLVRANVRFGSKADMCSAKGHVRFTPKADMCGATGDVRFVPKADMQNACTVSLEKQKLRSCCNKDCGQYIAGHVLREPTQPDKCANHSAPQGCKGEEPCIGRWSLPDVHGTDESIAEFANMKGADSAAVCLGDAQCKAISKGARNTPPPTPVSPETKPTAAPVLIAPHNGVSLSVSPSSVRRKTRTVAAKISTKPVTVL